MPVGSDAGIPLVMESDGSVRSLDAIFISIQSCWMFRILPG